MGFQTLYRAKAFGPGSDLWVLPEPDESEIATRIDWYLNFQIAKSKVHQTKKLGPEIEQAIKTHDLRLPEMKLKNDAPLLIASEQRFPNRMVVEIKMQPKAEDWIHDIQTLWTKLDRPKLRVFLPRELTPEQFQKAWKSPLNPSDDVTLVPPT